MNNLYFSINATMPVFLVMVVGYVIKRFGMINEEFLKVGNRLVFKVTLPAMLFIDMSESNIRKTFDGKYVFYCAFVTLTCILVIWLLSKLLIKDKNQVGEFVQASYRGSAAILGIALLQNICGDAKMAPVMILGSVPLYNIFAVTVLTLESPELKNESKGIELYKKAFIGICKNPIILSIFAGMLFSVLDIKLPGIIRNTTYKVGSITTPLALIVIGGGFKGREAIKKVKLTVIATFIKLILQPLIFLPVAVYMGFEAEKLVAALIMLGAPTTATSYVMAKNMGHEGTVSASAVALTTFMSAFTVTFWVFVLKQYGLIG